MTLLSVVGGSSRAHAQEIVEYYGTDPLGAIRVVFDANGAMVGRMDYGPFGQELSNGTGLPSRAYAGLFRDGEAGLDYAEARMYQSRTGRFNAVDPLFDGLFNPQAWNRYAYALNSPVRYTDPEGMTVVKCPKDSTADICVCVPLSDTAEFWRSGGSGGGTGRGGPGGTGTRGRGPEPRAPDFEPPPDSHADSDSPEKTDPEGPPVQNTAPKKPSTLDCFYANYAFASKVTNTFLFEWHGPKTAVGMAVASQTARATGLTTIGMAASDTWWSYRTFARPIYGVANLGVRGTLASVSANSLVNGFIVVYPGLKIGIAIGSVVSAGYSTGFGYCGSAPK